MERFVGCFNRDRSLLWKGASLLCFALALVLLPLAQVGAVSALQPLPQPFYGTITIEGHAVPTDKTVVAKVDGVECGRIDVQYPGKYGSDEDGNFEPFALITMLSVQGNGSVTVENGDIVEFYLGSVRANQSAVFSSGADPTRLDLTFPPTGPEAIAGPDQTVTDDDDNGLETINLDGSASSDPDLSIVAWEWSEDSVMLGTGEILSWDFAVGSYTVTLTVTDITGLTDTDQVLVTVNAASEPEEPPVEPPSEPTPEEPPSTPAEPPPEEPQPEPGETSPSESPTSAPTEEPGTTEPESPETGQDPPEDPGSGPEALPSDGEDDGDGLNWALIGGILAAVLALIVLFFVLRRPASRVDCW